MLVCREVIIDAIELELFRAASAALSLRNRENSRVYAIVRFFIGKKADLARIYSDKSGFGVKLRTSIGFSAIFRLHFSTLSIHH